MKGKAKAPVWGFVFEKVQLTPRWRFLFADFSLGEWELQSCAGHLYPTSSREDKSWSPSGDGKKDGGLIGLTFRNEHNRVPIMINLRLIFHRILLLQTKYSGKRTNIKILVVFH